MEFAFHFGCLVVEGRVSKLTSRMLRILLSVIEVLFIVMRSRVGFVVEFLLKSRGYVLSSFRKRYW